LLIWSTGGSRSHEPLSRVALGCAASCLMTGRGFAAPRAQARVFVRVRMAFVRRRGLLRTFVGNWPEEASRGAWLRRALPDRLRSPRGTTKFFAHRFVFAQSPLIV
ncbi:MAG TPA: hypothetical protein VIJ63_13220, partial [Roseiarcus sp.]